MKRFAAFLLLLVSALAGAARWLDVVNYTDLDTGFVTWGPAWARYAIAGGILVLLALGALPIVNENDTVSTAEIAVGDNDTLGAIVAVHLRADLLVLLTDIDGLYTADPHTDAAARRIERVEEVTDAVLALGGGAGSAQGTGVMATKLYAARLATQHGVEMVIANGKKPEILYDILEGKPVGTRFSAQKGARA